MSFPPLTEGLPYLCAGVPSAVSYPWPTRYVVDTTLGRSNSTGSFDELRFSYLTGVPVALPVGFGILVLTASGTWLYRLFPQGSSPLRFQRWLLASSLAPNPIDAVEHVRRGAGVPAEPGLDAAVVLPGPSDDEIARGRKARRFPPLYIHVAGHLGGELGQGGVIESGVPDPIGPALGGRAGSSGGLAGRTRVGRVSQR